MNSSTEIDNFIKAIKMRRKSLGLTQKDLADKLGWSRDKYARMEGDRARITFINAYRISSALGLGLSDAINLNVDKSNSSYSISFRYV
jgi:transcriptional regulator with XRE-family HTH domain